MALAGSAGCLLLVLVFFLIAAAFGSRVLKIAGLTAGDSLDNILFSSGAGFAALQFFLGILALVAGLTLRSVIGLLVLTAMAGGSGWKSAFRLVRDCWKDLSKIFESRRAKVLGIGVFFFAGLEALISTAPLTGSDAMNYHFTTPLLQMGRPEHPIFWLTNSFLTGLGHELIGMGLVLGGDKLALLLIFFGGCLTAFALLQFARRFMTNEWALATVLTFLMTPMVFWQISTAGSPDIWMGFYALLAVLALAQMSEPANRGWLVLAGIYAGAGASIKYTGWVVPIAVILIVLWWTKSLLWTAYCSIAAVTAGALPVLRNFIWTGDPFFPFLNRWMGKIATNEQGFKLLRMDIHSRGFSTRPMHILYFLTSMVLRGEDYGLGHYFGPIVLAFLPLLIFFNWRSRPAQAAVALWLSMLLANALTTQMARFLLPAYPLALALALAGAAAGSLKGGNYIRAGCAATLVVFGLFCVASDVLYARDFVPVAIGLESKEAFLERAAPEYQAAAFANSALAQGEGKAFVYIRHLYYLRVPYVNGSPGTSWMVNPDLLTSPQLLLKFFKEQDIRWVVKTADYPPELASVLEECEKEGIFVPETRTEVLKFSGNSRVLNNRQTDPVILFRVAP